MLIFFAFSKVHHYRILSKRVGVPSVKKYSLENCEILFDSIIQLVDYYNRCSNLICSRLVYPYMPRPFPSNPAWLNTFLQKEPSNRYSDIYDSNVVHASLIAYEKDQYLKPSESLDDEPQNLSDIADLTKIPEVKRSLFENEENYDYEPYSSYIIDPKDLITYDKLGSGNYGTVYRGSYKLKHIQDVPVAIKQLNMDTEESKKEIIKEAELMKSLNNPHIVKFIGMCFDKNSLSIVLELAKLGPLHKYLRAHKGSMTMAKIVKICYQVAVAMEYLSSKGLVHRDLAARNVLLVSEDMSKVSDFGMSRKMDESDCYTATNLKSWPLKWYPPDATYHGKFDEKSDVWSFGVTCWEATSYGGQPYYGVDIHRLLLKLENGYRLEKPDLCPDEFFVMMYKCWLADRNVRPRFKEIVTEIRCFLKEFYPMASNAYV